METSGSQYIGRVERIAPDNRGMRVGRVIPFGVLDASGISFFSREDSVDLFPSRGNVMWFAIGDERVHDGSIVQFRAERIENESSTHLEQFRVARDPQPMLLHRVLRLGGSWVSVHRSLASLALSDASPVLIQVGTRECAGPFNIIEGTNGLTVNLESLEEVPVLHRGSSVVEVSLAGETYLNPNSLQPIGELIDLRPARAVTQTILRKILKDNQSLAASIGLSSRGSRIAEFLDAFEQSSYIGVDANRLQIAKSYLSGVLQSAQEAEELTALVIGHPQITAQLEEARQRMLADAEREAAVIRESADRDARVRIERNRSEVAELEKQARELESVIAEHHEQLEILDRQVHEQVEHDTLHLEQALRDRLRRIQESAYESVADVMMFRALGSLHSTQAATVGLVHGSLPASLNSQRLDDFSFNIVEDVNTSIREISERQKLVDRLARGIGQCAAQAVVQGLLSKAVPVLFGFDASAAIGIVANTVAGGRVHHVPVSPGLLSPADLLLEKSADSRVSPATNRILDLFLLASEHPEHLFVLALEGVNRSAVETFLLPLLHVYSGNRSRIPLFRPEALPSSSVFQQFASLAWPPNVLLLTTAADPEAEVVALPIPRVMWECAVPIHDLKVSARQLRRTTKSQVSAEWWESWKSSIDVDDVESQHIGEFEDIADGCRPYLPPVVARRLATYVRYSDEPVGKAATDAFARWLPYVLADIEKQEAIAFLEKTEYWDDERHRQLVMV